MATITLSTPAEPRVLIVGNEQSSVRELGLSVEKIGLRPLGPVTSASCARTLYQLALPPLLILNVQLGGGNDGIDLAYQLMALGAQAPVPQTPAVVFTAASVDARTVARARGLHPLGFLQQPYDLACLRQLICQALPLPVKTEKPAQETMPVKLELLAGETGRAMVKAPAKAWSGSSLAGESVVEAGAPLSIAEGRRPLPGRLFVRESGRLVRIDPADITCVQMEEKYSIIVTSNGRRHPVRMPLAELQRQLLLDDFVRVHRSWLVNLQRVDFIDPVESVIYMVGGTEAPLGRAFRAELLRMLPLVD